MKRKAQASSEYLMVYVFAIIIVITSIAVLSYLGVFDHSKKDICISSDIETTCLGSNIHRDGFIIYLSKGVDRDVQVVNVSYKDKEDYNRCYAVDINDSDQYIKISCLMDRDINLGNEYTEINALITYKKRDEILRKAEITIKGIPINDSLSYLLIKKGDGDIGCGDDWGINPPGGNPYPPGGGTQIPPGDGKITPPK